METPLPATVPPRRLLVMEAAVVEVEAHQPLLVVEAVAVKEAAVYSAELRHPRLPVTAVVAATMVATMVAVALRAMRPDEAPIRSLLLRSRKNVHRERRNRWSGRPSPFRKPPPRLRSQAGVPLSR